MGLCPAWRKNKTASQEQKKTDNWILLSEHLHFPLLAQLQVSGTS